MGLQVTLLSARDLYDADDLTAMNVFVVLRNGHQVHRSRTRKGTNPKFEMIFEFAAVESMQLVVELYAKHMLTGDRLVGRGVLHLEQAVVSGGSAVTVQLLTKKNRLKGQLDVMVLYNGPPIAPVAPCPIPSPVAVRQQVVVHLPLLAPPLQPVYAVTVPQIVYEPQPTILISGGPVYSSRHSVPAVLRTHYTPSYTPPQNSFYGSAMRNGFYY